MTECTLLNAIKEAVDNGINIEFRAYHDIGSIHIDLVKDRIHDGFIVTRSMFNNSLDYEVIVAREIRIRTRQILDMEEKIKRLREETNEQA